MLGVLITLVFSIGAVGLGRWLLGRWTGDFDPAARLGLHGLAGLASLGLLTLPIGLLSKGLQWGILPIVALSLVGLALFTRDLKGHPIWFVRPEGGWALAPLVLGIALLFSLMGVLAPSDSNDWDSLAYHLAVPKMWLQQGQITFVSFIHHSNFPLTVDGLFIWGLTWGGQHGAKAFTWVFGLLTLLTLFGLARQRYDAKAGWWAALAFGTIPVVVWLSGTAYIDVPNGAFAGLGILFTAWLIAEPEQRRFAWLAGIFLGFAAGSKYTGLQTIAACGAILLAFGLARRDVAGGFKNAVLVAGLAVLISAPWYVRNVVNTGNPVYPFFYSILGGKNWSPYNARIYSHEQQTFGAGRAAPSAEQPDYARNPLDPVRFGHAVLGLAYQPGRYINPGQIMGFGLPMGAMGVTTLAALLLWMFSGRMSRFEGAVVAAVGFSLLFWFVLSQQSRYIVALAVPLAVLFGGGTQRLRAGPGMAVLAGVQAVVSLYILHTHLVADQLQVVAGKVPAEEYQTRRVSFYGPSKFINEIAKGGKVALYDETFGYFLDVPYFWANPGHTTELGYEQMQTSADLVAALKRLGITHVYFTLSPVLRDDRNLGEQWLAATGLRGAQVAFPDEVRQRLMADPGSKWRILLADAIASGELIPLQVTGTRMVLQVR
jgi:hypothetical protein